MTLPLSPDNVLEANETFQVVLSNPSAGAEISVGQATGVIRNDDVVFNLLPQADSFEGSGGTRELRYVVERSGDLAGSDSITWSLAPGALNGVDGSDFVGGVLPSGTLVFAAGVDRLEIVLHIATDSQLEGDESFVLSLGTPNPGATVGNGSINGQLLNDDQQFSIQAQASSVSEGGDGQVAQLSFVVNRSGYLGGTGSVAWRVVGEGGNPVDGADFVGACCPAAFSTSPAAPPARPSPCRWPATTTWRPAKACAWSSTTRRPAPAWAPPRRRPPSPTTTPASPSPPPAAAWRKATAAPSSMNSP